MLRLYVLGQNLAYSFKNTVARVAKREEGASLVEYGLLVALIAVVCIAGITALGGSLNEMFNWISGKVDGAMDTGTAPTTP